MKYLILILLFVGCASPKYYETKLPAFSYADIDHQQKVETGDSKKEMLARFGKPDRVLRYMFVNEPAIELVYYYKIFCEEGMCTITVSSLTNKVLNYSGIRMEFTKDLM
jgi:hypothetical protein